MRLDDRPLLEGADVPEADRAVGATGGERLAVGAEGHARRAVLQLDLEERFFGALVRVPQLDGAVLRPRRDGSQELAVGAESEGGDVKGVPLERGP
jgi:hypothetical protein